MKSRNIINIFKTDGSLGRSILTAEKPDELNDKKTTSVVSIAKKHGLSEIFVIDDNFINFPSLYKHCKSNKIKLIFGINFLVCNDVNDKSEESLDSNCKISVLMKNSKGYEDILNLHNKVRSDEKNFYYSTRADWKMIKENWTENLELVIPPYDNFIHNNFLCNGNSIPDFGSIKPTFLYSNQDLPYNKVLTSKIIEFASSNKFEHQECHLSYYYKESDFKSYCVFRAIHNKKDFGCPDIDFLCSNKFSFESYLNKNDNTK